MSCLSCKSPCRTSLGGFNSYNKNDESPVKLGLGCTFSGVALLGDTEKPRMRSFVSRGSVSVAGMLLHIALA